MASSSNVMSATRVPSSAGDNTRDDASQAIHSCVGQSYMTQKDEDSIGPGDSGVLRSLMEDFHAAVDEKVATIIEKLTGTMYKGAVEVQGSAAEGDVGSTARKRARQDCGLQRVGMDEAEEASCAENAHKKFRKKEGNTHHIIQFDYIL